MCILVTELLLPKLGKDRVPDSVLGEVRLLLRTGSWTGKAIFYSGTWWRKVHEDSWSAHNVSSYWSKLLLWCYSISGLDHPGKTPRSSQISVSETKGWSATHPSCLPTSLMEWVQLLQKRTCGIGLAKPHKFQVRPEQQRGPTALCHKTLQRASLLSRRAEWAEVVPQPIPWEEFHY